MNPTCPHIKIETIIIVQSSRADYIRFYTDKPHPNDVNTRMFLELRVAPNTAEAWCKLHYPTVRYTTVAREEEAAMRAFTQKDCNVRKSGMSMLKSQNIQKGHTR